MLRRLALHAALLVIVVLTGMPVGTAAAGAPFAPPPGLPPVQPVVRLLSSTPEGVAWRVDVPWQSLSLEPLMAGGQQYVRVSIPGWSTTGEAGSPQLPVVARVIAAPVGAGLRVRVTPGPAHTITLSAPVSPVETMQVDWNDQTIAHNTASLPLPNYATMPDPAVYSGSAPYSGSGLYPAALAKVTSDGFMRQQRLAGVVAYPVQYRPSTKNLTVYEWLQVEVTFEAGLAGQGAAVPAEPESAAYESLFRDRLLNYEAARGWRAASREATYDRGQDQPSADATNGSRELQSSSATTLAGALARPASEWAPPVPGWRIKVRSDGMVRLTYQDLLSAGLPLNTFDPRTLQVYYLGSEVAIFVVGEADGAFDPGDYLLFYGQAPASKYTLDNVYWLTYGEQPGRRMAARSAAPGNASTPGAAPAYYLASRHFEANTLFQTRAPGDAALDRWLWAYIYPPDKQGWSHTFVLPAPYAAAAAARLRVAMLGGMAEAIAPDHHTKLYLNDREVEDARWDGLTWRVAEVQIPQSYLTTGENTISVTCPNDTGVGADLVYVDWAELEYAATFGAEGDVLAFGYEAAGTWEFQIDGFTSGDVAVYDVTDPGAVTRIEAGQIVSSGSTYSAVYEDSLTRPVRYWLGTGVAYSKAFAIEADVPSNLRARANGADHITITHAAFSGAAATLSRFRGQQGLRAAVVDVQDVYDEFGYGVVNAEAIHDFLAYAYSNWQPPAPSYVVLLGDGHYDPKDYLGYGRTSFIPPYLASVDPWIGETAADNRYTTIIGADTLPDLMLGRLSVNSPAEANTMVDKIITYETSAPPGEWQHQVLAVADNQDSAGSFGAFSDDLLAHDLPAPFTAEKVYYGITHPDVASAASALQAGINAGKLLVNYIGHAAVTAWASEGLFKTSSIPSLQNGARLPVVLPMTCYDGYFHYPYPYSEGTEAMAEVLTRAGGGGAIASWSPTGLGTVSAHTLLDRGFFDAVFRGGERTLGAATTAAKTDLWATGADLYLLDTYLLFGDPATRLPLAPASAPVPPDISIELLPGTPNVRLWWPNRIEDPFYEVWRGTEPYFQPDDEAANQIRRLSGEPYGAMGEVPYVDDGLDRYSSGAGDPLLDAVEVIGDPDHNYFWLVRGRDGEVVSEASNRVGEFDYELVRGQ